MEAIHVRGLEIAFERAGSGPTLALVHGAGDDHRVWRAQLDALADACTVVAWDEPGSGRSSDIPPGFGMPDHADCLAALIDAVGGPAIVCGISWGGTVALELSRRHPEVVSALILADTYAGWKGSLPESEVVARVAAVEEQLAGPRAARALAAGLFAGAPPPEHVALLRELAASARPATLRAQLAAMASADLRDVLPRIAVPTLLVWGDRDARSPLTVARAFEAAIPNASLVVLRDCGHLSNLEQPEAFTAAVRAFCDRLEP
ncbi:MAG: alpha/beta fold hydrolase [Actinomycetota bacterium]